MSEPRSFRPAPDTIDALRALRRDLHAHPELGYQETRTSGCVAERLRAAGYEVTTGIAGTGVVGVLDTGRPGPTLGWRADMDALPIVEENDVDYRSANEGVMHACGHDVHTTVGLGTAEALAARRDTLRGRLVFVFQPNEEGAPGAGPSGAQAMVDAGVIEDFGIEAMFAMHCMPSLEVGKVGFSRGGAWAASDRFLLELHGEQTHGAYPHLGVDPIVAAAQIVVALQSIPSRLIDTQQACIVSVCQLHAGNQFNVIPGKAMLEGIVRTLDADVRKTALEAVRRTIEGIAAATGTRAELSIHAGAELTSNDAGLLDRAVSALRGALGDERIVELPAQMGAEDFASFSQAVPSVYLMLGIRNDQTGQGTEPLHSPRFDVDEQCLGVGVETAVGLLASLA